MFLRWIQISSVHILRICYLLSWDSSVSRSTTVQPQKELPLMVGMMTLETSHSLATVLLLPSPFRLKSASPLHHAINILVNTGGRLEGNIGKYAIEGSVTPFVTFHSFVTEKILMTLPYRRIYAKNKGAQ
jgi:hypothetical protein